MIKTFIIKAFHKIEKIQTENHRTRKIVKDLREVTEVEEALLPGIDVIKHVQTSQDQNLIENCIEKVEVEKVLFTVII